MQCICEAEKSRNCKTLHLDQCSVSFRSPNGSEGIKLQQWKPQLQEMQSILFAASDLDSITYTPAPTTFDQILTKKRTHEII